MKAVSFSAAAACCLLITPLAASAQTNFIAYLADFEAAVGPEWSTNKVSVTPTGARRFLGDFGSQTVTLSLSNLPPHSAIIVSCDLFLIRSWDGSQVTDPVSSATVGPDVWRVALDDGRVLLHKSFSTVVVPPYTYPQSYPGSFPAASYPSGTGATELNTLGYTFNYAAPVGLRPADSVYRIELNFTHSAADLGVLFRAIGLQSLADEAWGLDNVRVELLDSPTAAMMTEPPVNRTVAASYPALFQVSASGTEPLFYQWRQDDMDVPNATNAAWFIPSVTMGDSGNYSVVVSNALGSVTSSPPAVLTVEPSYYFFTLAGLATNSGSADGVGTSTRFNFPWGGTLDASGNLYVADRGNHTIRMITAAGVVCTVAGLAGSSGSANGVGSAARFNSPSGVAMDNLGNLYVTDTGNDTLRRIAPNGAVTTFAGMAGSPGTNNGTGSSARFGRPVGIATDSLGNIYTADFLSHAIRKITTGGVVTTLAGMPGVAGSTDGTGSDARFRQPEHIAIGPADNIYVADTGNHIIRKVTLAGVVTTLAGSAGRSGSADGIGSQARFSGPKGVAADNLGNVYVSDTDNHTVRKISPNQIVTTLAGLRGFSGSVNASGNSARFNFPWGMTVDAAGNLFLADRNNNTIRQGVPDYGQPIITLPPRDQTVSAGTSIAFSVTAIGTAPLSYQWQKGGVDLANDGTISGADTPMLTLSSVLATAAGNYRVVVSNAHGIATSTVATLTVLLPPNPPAELVYLAGFDGNVGPEWSNTRTDITPSGRRFLGQFGNQTVTLALSNLSPHNVATVEFDLYIIRSWDGNASSVGPDIWSLQVPDGPLLLRTTFGNGHPFSAASGQAYPDFYPGGNHPHHSGAAATNSLGYTFSDGAFSGPMDSVYHFSVSFPHCTNNLVLNFAGSGLQGLADESWGLDNVVVATSNPYSFCSVNLIQNGDAEAGPGANTNGPVVNPPGWTTTGRLTAQRYGSAGAFLPRLIDPGPPNPGSNFFYGGTPSASSSAAQTIDVSASACFIDSGQLTFTLSGYLGGFSNQTDHAVLSATFKRDVETILSTATIGPVTPADRTNITGMLLRTTTGSVPIGTRSIDVVLTMTRLGGNDNDGYADNLSLVFDCAAITPLQVICSSKITMECAGPVGTPVLFSTTALDSCDTNVQVVCTPPSGSLFTLGTNTVACVATDCIGSSNHCSFTVTVQDTIAPLLTCATNRFVECGTPWDFALPEVSDNCDDTNVALTMIDTVTNALCGSTYSATRTWQATDSSENNAQCSQTMTIVDTSPPELICATDIVAECTGPAGTEVTFSTSASDVCDSNVLVVCTPPSGSAFPLGTNVVNCVATDACGNTNACRFLVIIQDTLQPQIVCPPNLVAAENPPDSGGAIVTFPNATAIDDCNDSLTVWATPASGSLFPTGTSTVLSTALDLSGNSNTCTFTIRVVPYRLYVTSPADSGPGTLRQALLDANESPGENLILFNLPGEAPHRLAPQEPLPDITSPVILDGWSQPGFAGQPVIELSGAAMAQVADGLVLSAGASIVRGLVLNGFANALHLRGAGGHAVFGNFIGTDLQGTNAMGNTACGILVTSDRNLIGGVTNGTANLISGNALSGVCLDGPGAVSNRVFGNLIGLAADVQSPLPNGADGVTLKNGAAFNLIGGLQPAQLNLIAFNGGNGVALAASAGLHNAIRVNVFVANVGLGIDLGLDGITANDPADADTGPNGLQNFPVLSDARSEGGAIIIEGTMTGVPNTTYRLDFYLNDEADPSGHGEGQKYFGSTTVMVTESGIENFTATFPVAAVHTQWVTATATDAANNTSEFSPAIQVRTPPVLESPPEGTSTASGDSVMLCATATGTPPFFYQWRLNGANIPGATNQCYDIPSVETSDGGTYSVVVYNLLGAIGTPPAPVELQVPNAPKAADNFVNRVRLTGKVGRTAGSNIGATFERGEPQHAGKPGGKSVWYTWKAPVKGIVTLRTAGSTFDTLLAVYTGKSVTNLVTEASDEDRGGFFTSGLRFNAIKDRFYHFAIDGFGSAEGNFVLEWETVKTPHFLPKIIAQPQDQTVAAGGTAVFTALAVRVCGNGHTNCSKPDDFEDEDEDEDEDDDHPKIFYQWLFNGNPILGETRATLTIRNVDSLAVGAYSVLVSTRHQGIESLAANLQINNTGDLVESVQAQDKLLDAALAEPLRLGIPHGSLIGLSSKELQAAPGVVRGYTGTQVFNTTGSATEGGEEPLCGVLGGASEWITFIAEETGSISLNTDGSSYDTVIAVFTRATNSMLLQLLGCDNNSGLDGLDSSLVVPVQMGKTNFILVDGVLGATGILVLNYSLTTPTLLTALSTTVEGASRVLVTGRPGVSFTIQRSTNLQDWASLVTTNAPSGVYEFVDTGSQSLPGRFYRAQVLP